MTTITHNGRAVRLISKPAKPEAQPKPSRRRKQRPTGYWSAARFDAALKGTPKHAEPARSLAAARAVLVDGATMAEACEEFGLAHASLASALLRLRRANPTCCPTCGCAWMAP